MADLKQPVILSNRGAPIGLIEGQVFAFLMDQPPPSTWSFTAVAKGYQIHDVSSGKLLALPDPNSQAAASSSGLDVPNSTWVVTSVNPDRSAADDQTNPRFITLKLAGTDLFIGRAYVEDRSIGPKKIIADSGDKIEQVFEVAQAK